MSGSPSYQNTIKALFKLAHPETSVTTVTASIIKKTYPSLRVSNRSDWYDVALDCILKLRPDVPNILDKLPQESEGMTERELFYQWLEKEYAPVEEVLETEETDEEADARYLKDIRDKREIRKGYALIDKELMVAEKELDNEFSVEVLEGITNVLKLHSAFDNIVSRFSNGDVLPYLLNINLHKYKIKGEFTQLGVADISWLEDTDSITALHHALHKTFWEEYDYEYYFYEHKIVKELEIKFTLTIEDKINYFFWCDLSTGEVRMLNKNTNVYNTIEDCNPYTFHEFLKGMLVNSPTVQEARVYRKMREELLSGVAA